MRNEATGTVLPDMGLQRPLHAPRALESASRMGGDRGIKFRLRHSGVVVSRKGAAAFSRHQSPSVFAFSVRAFVYIDRKESESE